ncbi:MAG: hypothetical protein ACK4G1_06045 [Ignavibacteria bacterium]
MKIITSNFILILLMIALLSSCSFLNRNEEYLYYQWASVNKINVLSNQKGNLKLKLDLSVPTPCHEFHTRVIDINEDTIFVKYYSKVKRDIPCILIIGNIVYYDSFQLQSGKIYLFKFFKSDKETLDTLIFIN